MLNFALKTKLHFLLLLISLTDTKSTRILTERDIPSPIPPPESQPSNIITTPVHITTPHAGPTAVPSSTVSQNPLIFFMHDILGGTAPSERVVVGITTSTRIKFLPFAKRNGGVFPPRGGIPLVTTTNINNISKKNIGIINNNNLPLLTGQKGTTTSTIITNNGNDNFVTNRNTIPFVTAGQLPQSSTLMLGTITVIDDEITEGHELGSSVIGKAQGFYLASSSDGTSHTMVFTALFGDHEEDCVSFFGVHRAAAERESPIAVVGGTGKYTNAEGYAMIETLHLADQYATDGVQTLLQFTVYIT